MNSTEPMYRVRFVTEDKVYVIYARSVYAADLFGFVAIEEMVFGTHTTVVVDPSEEKLRDEFAGVKVSLVPMHAIMRIDQVERQGTARIIDLEGKGRVVTPMFTHRPQGAD